MFEKSEIETHRHMIIKPNVGMYEYDVLFIDLDCDLDLDFLLYYYMSCFLSTFHTYSAGSNPKTS